MVSLSKDGFAEEESSACLCSPALACARLCPPVCARLRWPVPACAHLRSPALACASLCSPALTCAHLSSGNGPPLKFCPTLVLEGSEVPKQLFSVWRKSVQPGHLLRLLTPSLAKPG